MRTLKVLRGLGTTLSDQFAFLGLGSNLGDRLALLQNAVDLLDADVRTRVDAVSSVYETAPVGGPEDQEPYYNLALRVVTRRTPLSLLALCNRVEAVLGRVRTERWGPRTIDVDVLLYGGRVVRHRDLQVPHPRLAERPFALIPLIEVAPGRHLPGVPGTPSLPAVLARLAPVEDVRAIGTQVRLPGGPEAPS
jgi:2-amino-4-hydroxy-6-hydroxymethyldihydropteridine diphosphokinase